MMNKSLAFDIVMFALYVIVSLPMLTGVAAHEWLGLALFAVFTVHLCVRFDHMMPLRASASNERTARIALNSLIIIALAVCVVSGVMVSGSVLLALGCFVPDGYFFWNPLHAVSAKVLLALLLVHIVFHGKWILSQLSKDKREEVSRNA